MANNKWIVALAVGSAVCLAMLGMRTQAAPGAAAAPGSVTKAEGQLIPTTKTDSKVKGTIWFTKTSKGMHVHGEITGLTPGEHGFHVHEYGVWNEDGMASGGHFNPTGAPHASHDSTKRHVGDMGNVKADDLKSQPSGNAGGRLAVAIIGVAKP
jgi:Cu-Zn family superoxide dismutase